MLNKRIAGLLAAGAFVAVAAAMPAARAQMMAPMQPPPPGDLTVYSYSNAPKADPGDDPANWSARQNVVDSDRYERLVHTNPAFRAARIRKECGGITEPDLYQQCVATFN
jgi:ABC-type transport system substrate-binding protein